MDPDRDGLASHATSVDSRLQFLESLLGDTADKHAREINAAKENFVRGSVLYRQPPKGINIRPPWGGILGV